MNKENGEILVHLINAKGERLHIPYSESLKLEQLAKEGKCEKYYADLDWYLSHGYVTSEQMWSEIESGNSKDSE